MRRRSTRIYSVWKKGL